MSGSLADIIGERSSEILAAWIVRFERSPIRFRRATKAATHAAQVANLVYTPGAHANGAPLATFDFTVNDADLGVTAGTLTIDVDAVNIL